MGGGIVGRGMGNGGGGNGAEFGLEVGGGEVWVRGVQGAEPDLRGRVEEVGVGHLGGGLEESFGLVGGGADSLLGRLQVDLLPVFGGGEAQRAVADEREHLADAPVEAAHRVPHVQREAEALHQQKLGGFDVVFGDGVELGHKAVQRDVPVVGLRGEEESAG